jgi:hypothetical protein
VDEMVPIHSGWEARIGSFTITLSYNYCHNLRTTKAKENRKSVIFFAHLSNLGVINNGI